MSNIKTGLQVPDIDFQVQKSDDNVVNIDSTIDANTTIATNYNTTNTPAKTETIDLSLDADTINTELPSKENITIDQIDFSKIATTKANAQAQAFLKEEKINKQYWGDTGQLSYIIQPDDTVAIYEDDVLMGFTTKEGILGEPKIENIEANIEETAAEEIIEETLNEEEMKTETNIESETEVETNIAPEPETTIQVEELKSTATNDAISPDGTVFVQENPTTIETVYKATPNTTYNIPEEYANLISEQTPQEMASIMPGLHVTNNNTTYQVSQEDLYKLYATVQCESNGSYEDALGVISVILNRVEDGRFSSNNPAEIATKPSQFAVWSNGSAQTALNNKSFTPEVIKAVNDSLNLGIRNNDYIEFKASSSSDRASNGELKTQLTSGGNKYHNTAQHIDRVDKININLAQANTTNSNMLEF